MIIELSQFMTCVPMYGLAMCAVGVVLTRLYLHFNPPTPFIDEDGKVTPTSGWGGVEGKGYAVIVVNGGVVDMIELTEDEVKNYED